MEILSFAMVGLMTGAVLLWRIPAARCDQCEHCQRERRDAKNRELEEMHRKMHTWYGAEHCPVCRPET